MPGRLLPLLVLAGPSQAGEPSAALRAALAALLPGIAVDRIEETPAAGIFEVRIGPRILYFTADGKHFLRGDLIDVERRENLTERTRRAYRLAVLEGLGEASMVVFAPPNPKHTITVFTDVDCPYCARLHREVKKLNELGVKVRYAAFPRAGIPSEGYDRMVSVWCAGDPRQAMTDAKAQRPIAPATCDNPVAAHFAQGQTLGVNGTPTIILESGDVVGGYRPYPELLRMLESG